MSIPIEHARHNKSACEYLDISQEPFPDWVITTAFYSAMHYAHAIIFPFTELNDTYTNIESYYNKHKKSGETKHSVTLDLIQKRCFPISSKYHFLKDTAHTARYHDYNVHKEVVKKAKQNLKRIAEYCEDLYLKKQLSDSTEKK